MENTGNEQNELKELLKETLHVTKENHKLLKAIRRDAWIGGIIKTLLWVVVLGLSFYFSVKYIEPLIQGAGQLNPDSFQMLIDLYQGNLSH